MDMKYEHRIRNKNQNDLPKSHCIVLTKCEIVAGPKSKRRGNRGRKKLLPVPPKLESFFAFLVLWNKEQLIMMAVMSLSLPLILVAAEIFEIRASLD